MSGIIEKFSVFIRSLVKCAFEQRHHRKKYIYSAEYWQILVRMRAKIYDCDNDEKKKKEEEKRSCGYYG